MKKLLLPVLATLSLCGCQFYQTPAPTPAITSTALPASSPVVLALENPNNIGKAVQFGVQLGATAFLARNTTYGPELDAAADALVAFAASNPAGVSQADIANVLAKTKGVSQVTQNEISVYAISGLSIFETSFSVSFPQLKPNYAIYVDAIANGLYGATGKPLSEVPLPAIPWPPLPANPSPTPTPAASSTH